MSCDNKVRYETREGAEAARQEILDAGKGDTSMYRCRKHRAYHLTRQIADVPDRQAYRIGYDEGMAEERVVAAQRIRAACLRAVHYLNEMDGKPLVCQACNDAMEEVLITDLSYAGSLMETAPKVNVEGRESE